MREEFEQDRPAGSEDVRRALGDVNDHVIVEVLAQRPSLEDLTRAVLWTRGDGDAVARDAGELSARALAIIEVLVRAREEEVSAEADER